MTEYQIYSVDPEGRIVGNRVIEAATDEEAIYAVKSMQRQVATEIWCRDRRIARVAALPRVAAPRTQSI